MPSALRILLIIVVGIAAFSNSIGNPMLLDDFETITENRQIRSLAALDVLKPERELPVAGRPLSNVTFALNYATAGNGVGAYHVTNLALHLLCAVVAFLLIERLLGLKSMRRPFRDRATYVAFTAALLWVVHPLNSEVVNYLTQRTESLMALFFLLTLYASVRALDSPARRWPLLAVASCLLGALCKESIAVAPLAVIALDRLLVFSSWRDAWRSRRGLYAGLALSWIVLAALQSAGPRPYSAGFSNSNGLGAWTYLLNQAVMIVQYLRLTVWPHELVVLYGLPRPLSLGDVMWQGLLVLGLLGATVVACRKWPAIGAAGIVFFLTLAPTSSILPIATEVGAERRMYLPLLTITILAAAALWHFIRSVRTSAVIATLVTLALGTTTYARNREYADPLGLAELTLTRWPTGMAHQLVAEELLRAGRRREAIPHLQAAVPDTPRARFELGIEYFNDGKLDDAIAEFQAFVRLEPGYLLVPDAQAYIARAYAAQERWADAEKSAAAALAKAPGLPDAQRVIALAQFGQSRFAEAADSFRRYLALRPSDTGATTNLALALLSAGQVDEGIAAFRRATELDPRNWATKRNLALALFDAGRPGESVEEARRAIALRPDDAMSHAILGQGLEAAGQHAEAVAEIERAVQLDPNDADVRRYLEQLRRR